MLLRYFSNLGHIGTFENRARLHPVPRRDDDEIAVSLEAGASVQDLAARQREVEKPLGRCSSAPALSLRRFSPGSREGRGALLAESVLDVLQREAAVADVGKAAVQRYERSAVERREPNANK